LIPDLLRGRGKSIGRELDIDEEGSEQIDRNLAITTPQLCWLSTHTHTSWPHQEGLSLEVQLRTQVRTGKNATKLVDECTTHKYGVL
jgi:hypothetical protein